MAAAIIVRIARWLAQPVATVLAAVLPSVDYNIKCEVHVTNDTRWRMQDPTLKMIAGEPDDPPSAIEPHCKGVAKFHKTAYGTDGCKAVLSWKVEVEGRKAEVAVGFGIEGGLDNWAADHNRLALSICDANSDICEKSEGKSGQIIVQRNGFELKGSITNSNHAVVMVTLSEK